MTKPLMEKVLVSVLAFGVFSFFLHETWGYYHHTAHGGDARSNPGPSCLMDCAYLLLPGV